MLTIEVVDVLALTVPTEAPEADGSLCWSETTAIVVRARAAGVEGLGYSYSHAAAARVVEDSLKPLVVGLDAFAVEAASLRMGEAIRNMGRPGIAMGAVSAVDVALWDLKARLLDLPLVDLLGGVRDAVPVYGSGGFTSYNLTHLTEQLAAWSDAGIRMVKMKVGTRPGDDLDRVRDVRDAVGEGVRLFVDANGAYSVKQAIALAARFAELGVAWFEEPVSSDDLDGLRFVRDHAAMDVAAGEYGHDPSYFRAMLAAGAVDVLQADATRCGGISGFLKGPCRRMPRRRCTFIPAAPPPRWSTSSGSMTMFAWRACCSTAAWSRRMAAWPPTARGLATGLSLKEAAIARFAR